MVDASGASFALALFGVRHGALKGGSAITLLDPFLSAVELVWEGKPYAFHAVRVDRPQQLLAGGAPLTVAQVALPASLSIKNMA